MNWKDIIGELEREEVLDAYQNDDLENAFCSLRALYHMEKIGVSLDDVFILDVINCAITERNKYSEIDGVKNLEYVKIEDGEFVWDNECYL